MWTKAAVGMVSGPPSSAACEGQRRSPVVSGCPNRGSVLGLVAPGNSGSGVPLALPWRQMAV